MKAKQKKTEIKERRGMLRMSREEKAKMKIKQKKY